MASSVFDKAFEILILVGSEIDQTTWLFFTPVTLHEIVLEGIDPSFVAGRASVSAESVSVGVPVSVVEDATGAELPPESLGLAVEEAEELP